MLEALPPTITEAGRQILYRDAEQSTPGGCSPQGWTIPIFGKHHTWKLLKLMYVTPIYVNNMDIKNTCSLEKNQKISNK